MRVSRRREVEEILRQLAASQHGVATRAQLLQRGLAVHEVDALVRTRRLVPVARGVYPIGPVPLPGGPEMSAVLAAGRCARVSHRSAARVHGLLEAPGSSWGSRKEPRPGRGAALTPGLEEVSVSRARRLRIEGVQVHRVRDLRDDEVTLVDGMPVTTAPRTLLDVAESAAGRELEQAYAAALRRGLLEPEDMRAVVERHPGHRGAGRWRRLLELPEEPAFTRSEAEEQLLEIVRQAGLPRPETNVRVLGHEVDFLWRNAQLVVEVDGYAYHASPRSFAGDRRRDADLTVGGYRVLRFTWSDLTERRLATIVRLAQALVR